MRPAVAPPAAPIAPPTTAPTGPPTIRADDRPAGSAHQGAADLLIAVIRIARQVLLVDHLVVRDVVVHDGLAYDRLAVSHM